MSSSWNPQRQMPNYCGDCFAYFPLASLAQHEMMVFHKLLTSARTGRGWMHLFDEATNFVFLGGLRAYLHSNPTNTNGHDMVCADYGLNSARACHLRCTIIHPVLQSNGVDFFDGNFRITRESYHATIEIILLYLQGSSVGVVRPLPSLSLLRRYGHCWLLLPLWLIMECFSALATNYDRVSNMTFRHLQSRSVGDSGTPDNATLARLVLLDSLPCWRILLLWLLLLPREWWRCISDCCTWVHDSVAECAGRWVDLRVVSCSSFSIIVCLAG